MESDLSQSHRTLRAEKDEKFLGNKRDIRVLRENLLFRRLHTGKFSGRYENLSNIFFNMMAFDWDEEKISKLRSNVANNFNASSFWFYICSMYFPYESNLFLEMEDEVPEMLGKFWQRMVENKRFIKKKSQTSTKNKFMNDIHSLLLEETEDREDEENEEFRKWSVDDIINQLSRKLSKVTECKNIQMTKLVSKLTHNNRFLCSMENEYSYDADDVLIDMKLKNPFSKKFIEFLISKHEKDKSKIKGLELETCIEKELPIYGCPSSQKLNKIILTRAEEEKNSNPDDVVCLICNDGDYEDNDLIVYCSMCQMTVHQNCYGIVDLPEGDWVCYPCRTYKENSREIECLLCPVKGGAMKPSTIKKFQSPYNIICKIRNLQTDKKNSPPSDLEQIGLNNNYYLNENLQDLTQEKTNIERINFFDDLTYSDKTTEKQEKTLNQDIFTNTPAKKSFYSQKEETEKGTLQNSMTNSSPKKGRGRNRKIKNKLKKKNHLDQNNNQSRGEIDDFDINNAKKYAWVHLSCALWLPEVQIGNYDKKDDIKGINIFKSGIDCIPKERFNETCSICSFSNYGPTVKCENNSCSVRFHVECARINKYQLEKGSSYSGEIKFYVYCQTHRPHRLIKNSEFCRQRTIEDIVFFSDILKKNYELLSKFDKKQDFSVFTPKRYDHGEIFKKLSLSKNEKNKIKLDKNAGRFTHKEQSRVIARIRELLMALSNMKIKISINDKMEYHLDYNPKEKISIPYEETINPEIFPWYMLEGVTRFSAHDVFCFYSKEIVPNKEAYNRIILKKSSCQKKNKKNKKNIPAKKEPDFKYCYCKRDIGGVMIECYYGREVENGVLNPQFECPNNGWMHVVCLSELKNLNEDVINSDEFIFACKDCLAKYGEVPKI